ncbi:hypothetical protein E4U54_007945, partial [Claviceps lovelessii]
VYFEMPRTQRTHKSMLLRGVQLPPPALTWSDIEVVRGRISRGARGPGYLQNNIGPGRKRVLNNNQGWFPPPPGAPGFGVGVPPPPPS